METITLKSLIEEQKSRIPLLKYEPNPPGCFGFSYNYYEDDTSYQKWLATTKRVIGIMFPNDKDLAEFDTISKERLGSNQQRKLLAILEAFQSVPSVVTGNSSTQITERRGKGKDAVNVVTTIHNAQSQEQSQQQTQSIQIFLEAIKDELTGKQQKELEVLAKEDIPEPEKRTKIIDKIKSFGSDVATNIIANIVTSPAIWG